MYEGEIVIEGKMSKKQIDDLVELECFEQLMLELHYSQISPINENMTISDILIDSLDWNYLIYGIDYWTDIFELISDQYEE